MRALEQTGGNFYEAARVLGLHPTYLYRLTTNLDIPSE
jgi:transcriptional regulator with GAF, ATPase, and Fis domain